MLTLPELSDWLGLCVALGAGLLIGVERERRKGRGPARGPAGVRTFTLTSMLGAVAVFAGGNVVLAVVTAAVGIIAAFAYLRTRDTDPGVTTEIALVFTCVLGGFAVRQPLLAAGVGVAAVALLAARNRLHHFVLSVLTERELHDLLVLAGIALVVLPLAPDRFMGPFDAINPHAVARLITLVMTISALGYVATRSLGPRYGLPLAGFAAGFVSSTATIHSMGELAKRQGAQTTGAVAGAVLSSIATIIQLAIVVLSVQPTLMRALAWPLVMSGAAACVYGVILVLLTKDTREAQPIEHLGRAFNLRTALGFGAIVSFILSLSAGLNVWLGAGSLLGTAALTGMVDPHATAASIASLVAAGKLPASAAQWPILAGLTTNTVIKGIVAFHAGGPRFAMRIVPGLVLMVAALGSGVMISEILAAG